MKTLKEIGRIEVGMILVDENGKEGEITGIYGDPFDSDFVMVEIDNNKDRRIMWDWSRLKDTVFVKDNTYSMTQ